VLPGDVSASKRYWSQDVIDPPVQVSRQGTIAVSDAPGLGYGLDEERIESLTERRQDLR
jgi:O-succinylbenzoate synthase